MGLETLATPTMAGPHLVTYLAIMLVAWVLLVVAVLWLLRVAARRPTKRTDGPASWRANERR